MGPRKGVTIVANATKAANTAENWIRNEFLPKKFDQAFAKRKLAVQSGGEMEYDAVSEDGKIVCIISTIRGMTAEGKPDTDVLAIVREKLLWTVSLNEKPDTIAFAYTEKSMGELLKQEKEKGRLPKQMKMMHVNLPALPA